MGGLLRSRFPSAHLPILLLCLLFPCALQAQGTLYTDSQNRFTVRVPEGWTTQDLGVQGMSASGDGLSLEITVAAGSPSPEVVAQDLVRRTSIQNPQEFDRQGEGRQPTWIILDGIGPDGKPVRARLLGMQGGGVTVGVMVAGERSVYNAQRGTIEAILATLRPGSNAPADFKTYARRPADSASVTDTSSADSTSHATITFGVTVREITGADIEGVEPGGGEGIMVEEVELHGPADQAGIMEGDVILEVDRIKVNEVWEFDRLMANYRVGDLVTMQIERNGRNRRVSVKVEAAE